MLPCPEPSNDLKVKSGPLKTTGGIVSGAADVIRDNGKVLMYDRDRVERWQAWWDRCKKGA